MKKFIIVICVVILSCSGMLFAGEATPIKLSLFPPLSVPSQQTVHGLDLGIISSVVDEVQGLQLAWIYASTSKKMAGVQYSFINIGKGETKGAQLGFYNSAEDMSGFQWGFINVADKLKGVQLGLINLINTGAPLKFMVILNANF